MQGCFKFCSFIFNTAAIDCHDAHVFLHWKSITSVEQTSFITDGEIEWVKVKMENNKDLLVGSFYIPQREQKHIDERSKSVL
jgi:hypothetical protein